MKNLALALFTIFYFQHSVAFELKTVSIPSENTEKNHQATVILPDGYNADTDYSVVYILHGWSGDYKSWHDETAIAKQADLHDIIIVLPDGNYDKWYIDSELKNNSNYQTYIGKEVVAFIDDNFNTHKEKSQRAITGLSMGGYGAFNIALNNLDTFGNIGSISGGVDPRAFKYNWGLEQVFGDYDQQTQFWDNKTIKNSVHKLIFQGVNISIDCGIDDFFIQSNRELHRVMMDLKIDHDYTERPGGHTWDYWDNAIKYQMLFFKTKFNSVNE
ncbi:alpha/beta hydrolase [Vibrio hippocampi]|uniref:Endo-1,4-beta-xylanase Z n=1 Tax=Vibrio hippocampi TaxID=654686 RepID=A0ABN8DIA7_9VIBR|nr:alpha/beta hydrolase family protein [Vibrio hippocampi]CAH0528748.1 Endo-1,4-beta-xylanase Z [Vibrio hippocampi]